MKLTWFLAGLILGSTGVYAQSPFLDFGAARQEDRSVIQQWHVEKEIRAGNNPYGGNPYTQRPCQ